MMMMMMMPESAAYGQPVPCVCGGAAAHAVLGSRPRVHQPPPAQQLPAPVVVWVPMGCCPQPPCCPPPTAPAGPRAPDVWSLARCESDGSQASATDSVASTADLRWEPVCGGRAPRWRSAAGSRALQAALGEAASDQERGAARR
ncbi:unnamed protein product [Prorocentrum cordatum]|uniref:Uncharacterized protein n=1 Tax=Prorocentrum cordatum TaxID=2364126 RepID=A0ABN9US31_9DINO|nr:unnamed protein product [Polarella glacialis]